MMTEAVATTNHDTIREWVEARDGRPTRVRNTADGGILRIDFDPPDAALEPLDWEEFFAVFDDRELAFLHQDRTEDGGLSRFNKFVDRDPSRG